MNVSVTTYLLLLPGARKVGLRSLPFRADPQPIPWHIVDQKGALPVLPVSGYLLTLCPLASEVWSQVDNNASLLRVAGVQREQGLADP